MAEVVSIEFCIIEHTELNMPILIVMKKDPPNIRELDL